MNRNKSHRLRFELDNVNCTVTCSYINGGSLDFTSFFPLRRALGKSRFGILVI